MYILHYTPDASSLAVRLVLEELGQPFDAKFVDRAAGAHDSPAFRQMQPLGLVPALETPDGPMFETAAILLYLADRHGTLAPSVTAPDRAAFLKWYFFTSTNVHTALLQLFYPDRVAGDAAISAVIKLARARMATSLTLLNAMVRDDNPGWLSPDQPSIFGYYVAMLLRWLKIYGPGHPTYFDSADYPALFAILKALETRPAARAAAAAENLGETIFTAPGT